MICYGMRGSGGNIKQNETLPVECRENKNYRAQNHKVHNYRYVA